MRGSRKRFQEALARVSPMVSGIGLRCVLVGSLTLVRCRGHEQVGRSLLRERQEEHH